MRTKWINLFVLCWASVAGAKDVYLPITGSVGVFRTDTRIFNPSYTKDALITATFLPVGRDNTGAPTRQVTVGKRQMLVLDDVVASLFGASGLGAVRLSSNDDFVASSRIYATSAAGTLGQFSPGIDTSAAKAKGLLIQLKATGLSQTGTFRTNMGFVNPNSTATTVTVRTYDAANTLVGSPSLQTIQPLSVVFPLSIDAASGNLRDAWVGYEASQATIAFASVIDNGTTDPTFIPGVEDPGVPPPVGCAPPKAGEYSFRNSNFPRNIAMRGNIVYVATSSNVNPFNFRAIDISNRTAPVLRGTTVLAGQLDSMPAIELAGDVAYVTSSLGLYVINIANPDTLPVLTRFQVPDLVPKDVRVSGRLAYVIGEARSTPKGRLSVLDISAPATPTQLGFFEGSSSDDRSNFNWRDLELIGSSVYIATDPPGISDSGGAIRAIDVSNPASPRDAGRFVDPDIARAPLATDGSRLLALGPRRLVVIDVSNPAAMGVTAKVDYGGRQIADDFEVAAGLAIVPDLVNDKVFIFDLTRLPELPQVGTISIDGPYRVEADERTLAIFLFNDEILNLFDVTSCFASAAR